MTKSSAAASARGSENDALQARALALCAAHQDLSPTRQPCAACAQDASTDIAQMESALCVAEADMDRCAVTLPDVGGFYVALPHALGVLADLRRDLARPSIPPGPDSEGRDPRRVPQGWPRPGEDLSSPPASSRCICLPELLPAVAVNCRGDHPIPHEETQP